MARAIGFFSSWGHFNSWSERSIVKWIFTRTILANRVANSDWNRRLYFCACGLEDRVDWKETERKNAIAMPSFSINHIKQISM